MVNLHENIAATAQFYLRISFVFCNSVGALVSAGFEVSATVVHDNNKNDTKNGVAELTAIVTNADLSSQQKRRQINMEAASSIASTNNKLKANDHLITMDSMVDWLTKVPENEL